MAVLQFPFRFERRYRMAAMLFGITPSTSLITVDGDTLRVRFGPWRIATSLGNIASVRVTGPYRFYRTGGPARLGITDRGLTFATNGEQGVCLEFHRPISGIDPARVLRHPNLTLTPTDVAGLVAALEPPWRPRAVR